MRDIFPLDLFIYDCNFEYKADAIATILKLSTMRVTIILAILVFFATAGYSQQQPPLPGQQQEQPEKKVLRFYPNPAVSIIHFDFHPSVDKSYIFQVYNFLGKKVYENNNVTSKTSINLTDFYRGIYIFQLRDRNGAIVESGKFQVSK